MFTIYSSVSLLLYNLMIFSYYRDLPDVANLTAFVQLLIVTPLSMLSIAFNQVGRSVLAREVTPAAIALLALVAGMVVNSRSAMPVVLLYHYAPVLTIIYVNAVASVRFTVAAWITVIVCLITAVDLGCLNEIIPNARGQIMTAVVLVGSTTLLANYKFDKEIRRAYLLNARERIRRNEISRFAEAQARDYEARRRTSEILESSTRSFSGVATAALDDFAQVSGDMRALAEQLALASDGTAQRAASMAAGAQMASTHVAATADAIQELAATASAVSREVAGSIEMANRAVERAGHTTATISRLTHAAAQIGTVVSAIHGIAERTKLLALNAMIEAARAGPAGRGFAVVAGEVKALALQAAQATNTISDQISAIRTCTTEAAEALRGIDATIGQISGVATEVSVVMRQQAAATEEISRNVAGAARSACDVSATAGEVQHDAEVTGSVAARVLGAASAVGHREFALRAHVADFPHRHPRRLRQIFPRLERFLR